MKNKFLLSLTAATVISISGCATFADMAGADSATLNAAAAQSYSQVISEARSKGVLDTSSNTYKRINAVYNRLRPYADQMNQTGHPFDWKLSVLKSNELNAFVMPGGKVVFYSGIVTQLKLTDAEIAAIMGHEMTHALEEHSKSKAGATTLTNMAVSIGKSYAGNQFGSQAADVVDLSGKYGIGLPYSRNLESKADKGGLLLMAKAGYNPEAAVSVWKKMNQMDSSGNNAFAKFTSTHPSNNDRIADLQKSMIEAKAIYASTTKK